MFGNAEFRLIVMCNLYSIFSCISIQKSCKLKLCCSLNDMEDFCTICPMLELMLINKISASLKFFVNSTCRPVILIYQM